MATLGAAPPDFLARLGQFSDDNRMALLGASLQLLGGGGFTGAGNAMMAGSKIDQSNRYLKREEAEKKKKEEEQARQRAALEAALGPDLVNRLGVSGASELIQAEELYKRKPKPPDYRQIGDDLVSIGADGKANLLYRAPQKPQDRFESVRDPATGIEYQINTRTGQKSVLDKPDKSRANEFETLATEAGYAPGSPERQEAARRKLAGAGDRLQAADKRMIWDSESDLVNLEATIKNLARAKEIAPKAYSGMLMPETRGRLMAWTGIDEEGGKATIELSQLLKPEAIQAMASTLTGATTNFELQEFVSILADPTAPPDLKVRTIERMEDLARRKRDLLSGRIEEIRGGSYSRPTGKQSSDAPAPPKVGQVVDGYRYVGGDPSDQRSWQKVQ